MLFKPQFEFIKPVSPQAAQLGFFNFIAFIEIHLLEGPDLGHL